LEKSSYKWDRLIKKFNLLKTGKVKKKIENYEMDNFSEMLPLIFRTKKMWGELAKI